MRDGTGSRETDGRHLFADRYALGAVLGRGGMADVYRAEDVALGRAVAVKIFRLTEPVMADTRRIESETRTLASLTHPGLVTLFDAGTAAVAPTRAATNTEGSVAPYLVMELIDGPTLSTFRAGAALSPAMVARIGAELAEALAYIHSVGVVHRDVKPANILLTGVPDGQGRTTKLTDFGIARVVDGDRLTEHGTAVGTAHYLSPEQATGTATGPPADVYSLGLVLIECLSGRMVFEGSAIAAAVARLHHDPSVPPELGSDWVSLLSGMTARSPQDRPTADRVAQVLRSLAESDSPTSVTAVPGPPTTPAPTAVVPAAPPTSPPRRTRTPVAAWVILAALSGAAAVAVAVTLWGPSTPGTPVSEPAPPPASEEMAPPEDATIDAPAQAPQTPAPTYYEPAPAAPQPPDIAPIAPIAPAPQAGNGNNGNGGNGNSGNSGNNGNPGNSGNSGNPGGGNNGNGSGNGR